MARPAKYNWEAIQEAYEGGLDKNTIVKKFKVPSKALSNNILVNKWEAIGNINTDVKNHILETDKAFDVNSGFIYIIAIIDTNKTIFYKIGFARYPEKRIGNLQVGNPFNIKIELCFYVHDMIKSEKELHTKFSEKRLNGEWFELTSNDIEKIKKFIIGI